MSDASGRVCGEAGESVQPAWVEVENIMGEVEVVAAACATSRRCTALAPARPGS